MKLMWFIWIFIIDKIVTMEPLEAICDLLTQDCRAVYSNKHTHTHHIRNSFKGFFPLQDLLMRTVNG